MVRKSLSFQNEEQNSFERIYIRVRGIIEASYVFREISRASKIKVGGVYNRQVRVTYHVTFLMHIITIRMYEYCTF